MRSNEGQLNPIRPDRDERDVCEVKRVLKYRQRRAVGASDRSQGESVSRKELTPH